MAATGLEQPVALEALQHDRQEPQFSVAGDQARPKGVEHGEVEAGVGDLQAEQVLPIDAAAHGIRRLAVGQTFEELENRPDASPYDV